MGRISLVFSDTIDCFESYDWPGNVRELENLLENLVITTPTDMIRRENLPKKLALSRETNGDRASARTEKTIPLRATVERAEREAIERAIQECGSVRKAASALEVDPSTVVRKMQGYNQETT